MKLKKEDPKFNFIPEHDRQADERKPYYLRVGFNKSTGTSDPRNEEQLHTPAELVKGVCNITSITSKAACQRAAGPMTSGAYCLKIFMTQRRPLEAITPKPRLNSPNLALPAKISRTCEPTERYAAGQDVELRAVLLQGAARRDAEFLGRSRRDSEFRS